MKEEYFKYILPKKKKLRKENKTKTKIKRKGKRNAPVLKRSNMKMKTTKAWRLGGSP